MELEGKTFGKYRVMELLGQGGMGAVFRAVHEELGREVALKVLPEARLGRGPQHLKRFMREAAVCSRLSHPNIVKVYDFGVDNEVYYYAMELLQAASLEDLMEKEPRLGVPFTLKVARDLASALAYYLPQGIVHRDLKPSNILLVNGGERAVVTDFGLVKDLAASRVTRTGVIVGTPYYVAPEVLQGGPTTASTDLWQVGVILYRMLAGEYPIGEDAKDAMALFAQIANREPRELRELRPDVPQGLAAVVMNCLAKDPATRYATGEELAADVETAARRGRVARRAGVATSDPLACVPTQPMPSGRQPAAAAPSPPGSGAQGGADPPPAGSGRTLAATRESVPGSASRPAALHSSRVPTLAAPATASKAALVLAACALLALPAAFALRHRAPDPAQRVASEPNGPPAPLERTPSLPPDPVGPFLQAIADLAPVARAELADDLVFKAAPRDRPRAAAAAFSALATSPVALKLTANPSVACAALATGVAWDQRCAASRRLLELLRIELLAREWKQPPPFQLQTRLAPAVGFHDAVVASRKDLTGPQLRALLERLYPPPARLEILVEHRGHEDTYAFDGHPSTVLGEVGNVFFATTDRIQQESLSHPFQVPAGGYRSLTLLALLSDLNPSHAFIAELTPANTRSSLLLPILRLSDSPRDAGWFAATTRLAPGVLPPGRYQLRLAARELFRRSVPRPNLAALCFLTE
ncbi:MAG: serine/threonine protein kinase [Candidatus Wallbacteria bacterium]|nr:serine/threonine protein kinase [Candidatus Wallbacteria bacterium]